MKKYFYYLIIITVTFVLCSCGTKKENNNAKPLGIYSLGEKNSSQDSAYACYEFTENGNANNTCLWKGYILKNGNKQEAENTYNFKLDQQDKDSYIIFLENDEDKKEVIYNSKEDTISDDVLIYKKEIVENTNTTENEDTNEKNKDGFLLLTDSMIDEIEDKINHDKYPSRIVTIAKIDYPNEKYIYTDFEVTNHMQTDDYTYVVYGKLYFKDNYANQYYTNTKIIYMAEIDEYSDNGYDFYIQEMIFDAE